MSLHSSYCLLRPPAAVTCDQIQKLSLPEHMASAKPELMLESGDFASSGIQGPGLKSQERGALSWKLLYHADLERKFKIARFLPRCISATRSSHEKAVCLSVCLSVRLTNAWIVTK